MRLSSRIGIFAVFIGFCCVVGMFALDYIAAGQKVQARNGLSVAAMVFNACIELGHSKTECRSRYLNEGGWYCDDIDAAKCLSIEAAPIFFTNSQVQLMVRAMFLDPCGYISRGKKREAEALGPLFECLGNKTVERFSLSGARRLVLVAREGQVNQVIIYQVGGVE